MELQVSIAGITYAVDLGRPGSLAIPLLFDGPQPSFFGAPPARAQPLSEAGFVGDTRQGGSCNVAEIHLVPHCNGTHTESIAHIVHDGPTVADSLPQSLMPAVVVSVTPVTKGGDRVITREALEDALAGHEPAMLSALIVRTLPNDASRKAAVYGADNQPPYFAADAMTFVVASGVHHLLVDFPSIDRMQDGGRLANHRIFWNLPDGAQYAASGSPVERTVTEMIFVEDGIPDGVYLLNLQIPAFVSDAAPSRPVIYPLVAVA